MYIEDIIIGKLKLKNVIIRNKSLKRIGINLKYRPDALMFFPKKKHYIMLEIDERQHNSYNEKRELIRFLRINNEIKKRGTIQWIRFNPDGYISQEKNKVDLADRIKSLSREIRKSIKTPDTGVKHMFYSERNRHMNLIKNI